MTAGDVRLVSFLLLISSGCQGWGETPVYMVNCPTEPVAMIPLPPDTTLVSGSRVDILPYGITASFEDCEEEALDTVIVRGEGAWPEDAEYAWVWWDRQGRPGQGYSDSYAVDVEDGYWWSTYTVPRYDWGIFTYGVGDGGYYELRIQADPSLMGSFGAVTMEFQYDCDCSCTYDHVTNKTFDYDGLDLHFVPDRIVYVEPSQPMRLTEFDIVWTTAYDYWACADAARSSGEFLATYRITSHTTGEVVDSGEVTVPGVFMGTSAEFRFTHPGLEVSSAPFDAFTLEVVLDLPDEVCECAPFTGEHLDVTANNRGYAQFLVDWCDCAALGDLAIEDASMGSSFVAGAAGFEVTWQNCYKRLCGSVEAETGEFEESIVITDATGAVRADLSPSELQDSLALNECRYRSAPIPSDLPPGEYVLTIQLDPSGIAAECPDASADNQIVSFPFEVLEEPDLTVDR